MSTEMNASSCPYSVPFAPCSSSVAVEFLWKEREEEDLPTWNRSLPWDLAEEEEEEEEETGAPRSRKTTSACVVNMMGKQCVR